MQIKVITRYHVKLVKPSKIENIYNTYYWWTWNVYGIWGKKCGSIYPNFFKNTEELTSCGIGTQWNTTQQ